jgi:hypothetical protein
MQDMGFYQYWVSFSQTDNHLVTLLTRIVQTTVAPTQTLEEQINIDTLINFKKKESHYVGRNN